MPAAAATRANAGCLSGLAAFCMLAPSLQPDLLLAWLQGGHQGLYVQELLRRPGGRQVVWQPVPGGAQDAPPRLQVSLGT